MPTAAAFGAKVSVKDVTVEVTVADSCTARLMYYMCCIKDCLGVDGVPDGFVRFTEYKNYKSMGRQDKRALLNLAKEWRPERLINAIFFQAPSLVKAGMGNGFHKIEAVAAALVVSPTFFVGGRARVVKEIMTFRPSWMQTNYYNARENLDTNIKFCANPCCFCFPCCWICCIYDIASDISCCKCCGIESPYSLGMRCGPTLEKR